MAFAFCRKSLLRCVHTLSKAKTAAAKSMEAWPAFLISAYVMIDYRILRELNVSSADLQMITIPDLPHAEFHCQDLYCNFAPDFYTGTLIARDGGCISNLNPLLFPEVIWQYLKESCEWGKRQKGSRMEQTDTLPWHIMDTVSSGETIRASWYFQSSSLAAGSLCTVMLFI